MRVLKAFIIGAIGLCTVITLFSLLIPARIQVSRAVLIDGADLHEVYQQVAHFERWKNWHPIFTTDSAILHGDYPGTAETHPNYILVHRGTKVIISLLSADSTSFKFSLRAKGENDIDNEIIVTPLASPQAVQVEWRSVTKLSWYPWEKFYGIFVDKLTGPGYERALNGLKDFIERSPLPKPGSE